MEDTTGCHFCGFCLRCWLSLSLDCLLWRKPASTSPGSPVERPEWLNLDMDLLSLVNSHMREIEGDSSPGQVFR